MELKYTQTDLDKILSLLSLGSVTSHEEVINTVVNNIGRGATPTNLDIMDAVSYVMGCDVRDISERDRHASFIIPRKLACYFSYYYSNDRLVDIALDMSLKEHATVINNARKISECLIYKDIKMCHDYIHGELRHRGFEMVIKNRRSNIKSWYKGMPSANPGGMPKGTVRKEKDMSTLP